MLQQEDRSWKEAVRHERLEHVRIEKETHLEEFKKYFFFQYYTTDSIYRQRLWNVDMCEGRNKRILNSVE